MPEAPEVEMVVRHLRPLLAGSTIDRSHGLHHHFEAPPTMPVRSVHRHGKWIVLDDGRGAAVLWHLGMSGSFRVSGPVHRHARWIVMVQRANGERCLLQFVDPRCMGRMRALGPLQSESILHATARSRGCPVLALGPDALSNAMCRGGSALVARWRTILDVNLPVKRALMSQRLVAGLGNIYAAEACWHARIDPFRESRTLSRRQLADLSDHVPQMLRKSIRLGGTSLGDANTFRSAGREGRAVRMLMVYGQTNSPCRRCGEAIRRDPQAGRSTFWCPGCQT